jgi:hypothetical protein
MIGTLIVWALVVLATALLGRYQAVAALTVLTLVVAVTGLWGYLPRVAKVIVAGVIGWAAVMVALVMALIVFIAVTSPEDPDAGSHRVVAVLAGPYLMLVAIGAAAFIRHHGLVGKPAIALTVALCVLTIAGLPVLRNTLRAVPCDPAIGAPNGCGTTNAPEP